MGVVNEDHLGQQQSADSSALALVSRNKYMFEEGETGWGGNELYKVKDEEGNIVCRAEREGVAYKAFMIIALVILVALLFAVSVAENPVLGVIIAVIGFGAIVAIILKPRNLLIYQSGSENEPMLSIIKSKAHDHLPGTYAIESAAGGMLGYLRYNWELSFFRPKMKCYGADSSLVCSIAEPLSAKFVRRWILFSLGLLVRWILDIRTPGSTSRSVVDFNVLDPMDSHIIGKFSRDTIELAPEAHIDGRICLAIGLMTCSALKWQ